MNGDWYCPKCRDFVSPESVTYREQHQVCGCPVYVPEEPKSCSHCADLEGQLAEREALLEECLRPLTDYRDICQLHGRVKATKYITDLIARIEGGK